MTKLTQAQLLSATIRNFLRKPVRYAQRNLTFRHWLAIAAVSYMLLPILFYIGLYQFQNKEITTLQQTLRTQASTPLPIEAPPIPPNNTDSETAFDTYLVSTKESVITAIENEIITHNLYPMRDEGTLQLSAHQKNTDRESYTTTIQVSGRYADIGEFLFALYALPIVIEPISISLTPETAGPLTILNAKVRISLYPGDTP